MSKRNVDGAKLYNDVPDPVARDILVYLITMGADHYGIQREETTVVAERTRHSRAKVKAVLQLFTGRVEGFDNPPIYRYTVHGTDYLIFRKWQDYQVIQHPGNPSCPPPPLETFQKLSLKTRIFFRHFSENFPDSFGELLRQTVETLPPNGGNPSDVSAETFPPAGSPRATATATATAKHPEGGCRGEAVQVIRDNPLWDGAYRHWLQVRGVNAISAIDQDSLLGLLNDCGDLVVFREYLDWTQEEAKRRRLQPRSNNPGYWRVAFPDWWKRRGNGQEGTSDSWTARCIEQDKAEVARLMTND